MNRPLSADPSLSTLRVGNSTPYNGHPSPKHMDETHLDKAMGSLYINQVMNLNYCISFNNDVLASTSSRPSIKISYQQWLFKHLSWPPCSAFSHKLSTCSRQSCPDQRVCSPSDGSQTRTSLPAASSWTLRDGLLSLSTCALRLRRSQWTSHVLPS